MKHYLLFTYFFFQKSISDKYVAPANPYLWDLLESFLRIPVTSQIVITKAFAIIIKICNEKRLETY